MTNRPSVLFPHAPESWLKQRPSREDLPLRNLLSVGLFIAVSVISAPSTEALSPAPLAGRVQSFAQPVGDLIFEDDFESGDLEIWSLAVGTHDVFGIRRLYPTADGTAGWDSSHWANGIPRTLGSSGDPYDPTGWSQKRGNGSLSVDGTGVLRFEGSSPRLYLNGLPDTFWKNVEVTFYYQRISDADVSWAGAVAGVRSGPDGHSSGGDPCTATTYYSRLRNDGDFDFEKELHHPSTGSARSTHPVWDGDSLPSGQWIGMKFVTYNLANGQGVRLEAYLDLDEGLNGGNWQQLATYDDTGDWPHINDGCAYPMNHIITQGGGVVLLRNTDVTDSRYRWFSVREISP